jgi:Holliday junction DNA helicase RuvA
VGDEVFLWVHHHIREDAQTLYGFATREERVCFEALLGAHGVGPALALAILSVHGPGALREVIATQDVSALCLVPGVGQKTAARLLVELQSRLDLPDIDLTAANGQAPADSSARRDVTEALAGLGYGPEEVRRVVDDLPSEGDPADLLREALRRLAVA